ncbi:MAG: 4Fe-4S dicluster domain-containing protein [Armatimonadetes bacterium]|nr:4Fe-4S dicluster domain-containing protein [Armatimonadota bacterium]
MSSRIIGNKVDIEYLQKLDPNGEFRLTACLQCARCSSGCTMREETDFLPHQLNRMAILGLEKELMSSKAIWVCVSCQTCFSRCPMQVNTPAMVDRLREMALDAPGELRRVKIFNEAMLSSIKRFGRTYDFMLMAIYKLRSGDLFTDLTKLPAMLRKGKFNLFPPRTAGRKSVRTIFNRVFGRREQR